MPDLPRYWMEDRDRTYKIIDRTRGTGSPVARADDPEIAARIVRLLNADLERTERQGAVVP